MTPPSRIFIRWMDTSSCLLKSAFDEIEWRRACAQRLWFNRYVRAHLQLYHFCVPTSVLDWLNVITSILSFVRARKSQNFVAFFQAIVERSLMISFSHAY